MPEPHNEVMIDLETWGTAPGSALRSVGAVLFNRYGDDCGEEFYANVSDKSCHELGLGKDVDTIAWWAEQSNAAQKLLTKDQRPIIDVMRDLFAWLVARRVVYPWSHGSGFDLVLIQYAASKAGLRAPWKFWNERDTRTIIETARLDTKSVPRRGVHHYAPDDCKHQIKLVQMAYKRITINQREK